MKIELIRKGDRGSEVVDIQTKLSRLGYRLGREGIDGVFGPATQKALKAFQKSRGIKADGIVGDETWAELVGASYRLGDRLLYLRTPFFEGDDVEELQGLLNTLGFKAGSIDGIFGPVTERGVREFQKSTGVFSDGIVGTTTLHALRNLRNVFKSKGKPVPPLGATPTPFFLAIAGKKIAVDFGHGHPDPGALGASGAKESEICRDLGLRFGNLIELSGGKVIYARLGEKRVALQERARAANEAQADFFLSFHLNGSSEPDRGGTSTYHHPRSEEGKILAEMIHESLLAALGRHDGGVHGKNFAVLRLTKMPAVLIEPVYITNPEEEILVEDEAFRQRIAVAVLNGVKNYLGT